MKRGSRSSLGLTLVEMATSLGVLMIAGGMLFSGLRAVSLLGAKNGAINVTHQQSRETIHRAVQQIRSSISIPSLADISLAPVGGDGPAAAVTYQTLSAGPFRVWSNVNAGTKTIRISFKAGSPVPQPGMRLIVPAFRIEDDITAVASMGGNPPTYNITLASPIASTITCSNGVPTYIAYYTQRSALVVEDQELRFYPRTSSDVYSVVSTNITSPKPFSIPASGNRSIQASFAIRDRRVTGLNLKSMDTTLQLTVPYRFKLTSRQ